MVKKKEKKLLQTDEGVKETGKEEVKTEAAEEVKVKIMSTEGKTKTEVKKEVKQPTIPPIEAAVEKLVNQYWKGEESALRSRIILLEITIARLRKKLTDLGYKE